MHEFSIFPEKTKRNPGQDMLAAVAANRFPPDTKVHFLGVHHHVDSVDQLDPYLEDVVRNCGVVALELANLRYKGERSSDKDIIKDHLQFSRAVLGQHKNRVRENWSDLTLFKIGGTCLRLGLEIPDLMYVDIFAKPSNARRMTEPVRPDSFKSTPKDLLNFIRENARYSHYRERTVVGQISEDAAKRPEGERNYLLIMGAEHRPVREMLHRAGVTTSARNTTKLTHSWDYVMSRMVRRGYDIRVQDMPRSNTERIKVLNYDLLQFFAEDVANIHPVDCFRLARSISTLSDIETMDLNRELSKLCIWDKRAQKSLPIVRKLSRTRFKAGTLRLLNDFNINPRAK